MVNMAPPENGNEYIPFAQLIELENTGLNTFKSKALAFGPASGNRTYGGHVYMQACYAAAQTVKKDMVLHVSRSSSNPIRCSEWSPNISQ